MFASMIGGDMVHMPFKGEGPALTEVVGGTPAEMIAVMNVERARWKKVIDTARVTLD